MKPFSLEEYLEHPDRKVVTRDGRPVRILCTDLDDASYPVAAAIFNSNCDKFTPSGLYQLGKETKYDLFFAPEKRVRWALFGNTFMGTMLSLTDIFETKEQAELRRKMNPEFYGSIVKLEWEE